jgi:predicted esterase
MRSVRRAKLWLGLLAGLATTTIFAAPLATQPTTEPTTLQAKVLKVQATFRQLVRQLQAKDWTNALPTINELETFLPKNPDVIYDKACILARLGRKKDALAELGRSIDSGYVDADHIKTDDDLQSLHDDPEFTKLVDKASKEALNYGRFPYEKGADLADVKTVEAEPAGGLRYRVRMSKSASADHPDRLVIWFHPSGGSMDQVVESLAPDLAKHHFALAVFTQKNYLGWDGEDIARLSKSVDAIGKIPGISAEKPIALGFSAGGQMMMNIYDSDPSQFAAMVLVSAYPVTVSPTGQVTIQPAPPNSPAVKKTPLLVFVGGDDGGSRVWTTVEKNWRAKGVPLDLNIIPNRKHEWLIDNADREKQLLDWLAALPAAQR